MFKGSTCDRLNVGDELPGKPERGSEKPDHCGDAGVTDGVSGMNITIFQIQESASRYNPVSIYQDLDAEPACMVCASKSGRGRNRVYTVATLDDAEDVDFVKTCENSEVTNLTCD